ncbi:MAG: PQQ-dependent sugar dehydrogenase [Chitinophagales bacterium]|nr:PQQ-dependent sugar dehydrogenase [Chitinophagales bacterium]
MRLLLQPLRALLLGLILALGTIPSTELCAQLPAQFTDELVHNQFSDVVGLTFDNNGRIFMWRKSGRVHIYDPATAQTTLLLDISEEVGDWRDHGLLGFALDPNFLTNGYFYLHYAVDRHHLLHYGTSNYNAATNTYYAATIMRVTRYTANPATGFGTTVPGSRFILLGETKETGTPLLHESHSTGSLLFGRDGTLLVATGDAASYNNVDTGSSSDTYWSQALTDGILKPKENIGALRSQLIDCHNGKILRLDPLTGNGVPSNPYYDAASPRAPRSRVWALGLRNPFRCAIRPNTGSTNPANGNPGTICAADVGWTQWEDLHIITTPAQNCGWPLYEGLEAHSGYQGPNVQNQDAPNPLFGTGSCVRQYYYFKELIKQPVAAGSPSFPNPCNSSQQITNVPKFIHSRPIIDWQHGVNMARTGTFSGNNAATVALNNAASPIQGPLFQGNAAVGGAWYMGNNFPTSYQNSYFQADYGGKWIRNITFNAAGQAQTVSNFYSTTNKIFVDVEMHPSNGYLYYVNYYPNEVRRIRYTGVVNQPPDAVASANPTSGNSPLTVQFQGSNSTDPEGSALTYLWTFGDGGTSTLANPTRTFTASGGTTYTVKLRVTDNVGLKDSTTLTISLNNTAPNVQINLMDNDYYSMTSNTMLNLTANVSDAEHSNGQLTYQWQTILLHDVHFHIEETFTTTTATATLTPNGCNGEWYNYLIVLRVTDPLGLVGIDSVRLQPNCAPIGATYCDAQALTPWFEWIAGVQLGTINNTSGKWYYSSFLTLNTNLSKGQSYPITLTGDNSWETNPEYWRVWIDFNKDGFFDDNTERVLQANSPAPPPGGTPAPIVQNINIPTTALTGATRMRVIMKRGAYPIPCEQIPFGEVEDYAVTIVAAGGIPLNINISTSQPLCYGTNGAASVNITSGTPPFTYAWSSGQTTATANNLPAGAYTVTVTSASGAVANATAVITAPEQLFANVAVQNATTTTSNNGSCAANPAGGTAPYSYIWNTGSSAASIINLPTGTYSVTISDALGCAATQSVTVSAGSSGTPTYCASSSAFPWHDWIAGVQIGTINNTSGKSYYSNYTAQAATLNVSGSYIISLSAGSSWTTYQENWRVWIDFNKDGVFQDPAERVLQVAVPAPPDGTEINPSSHTLNIPATAATGTTRMRISMKRGAYPSPCETLSYGEVEDYSVNIITGSASPVTLTMSALPLNCYGTTGTATVTASGGVSPYSYLWSNGQTVATATNLAAGTYTVTVTATSGNMAVGTATIVQPLQLTLALTVQNAASESANNGSAAVNPSGGTPPYSYAWNTGGVTPSLSNLYPGTYTVTVTDNKGCTATQAAVVAIAGGGGTTYCTSGSAFAWHDWIDAVQMGSISNSETNRNSEGYQNHTAFSTTVVRGNAYPIALTTGFSWETFEEFWRVWIDFNQDGIFQDPAERVVSDNAHPPANGTFLHTSNYSISIPATATIGTTRMRIAMKRDAYPTPCETLPYGEVEDYTLNILSTGKIEDTPETTYSITLYPNPAYDRVYFDWGNQAGNIASIAVYNAIGQLLLQNQADPDGMIDNYLDVDAWHKGVYMVAIHTSDGTTATRRLVVR